MWIKNNIDTMLHIKFSRVTNLKIDCAFISNWLLSTKSTFPVRVTGTYKLFFITTASFLQCSFMSIRMNC